MDGEGSGAIARTATLLQFPHFYDPHTPYAPPAPFQPQQDTDAARYRGEVAYVDSLVGRLLTRLSSRELDESTLVAVISDHGEALGAHGERTHGFFLYDATLRVPWILRFPGVPGGTRVPGLARIVDVAPTLLDLLSLPPLDGAEGQSLVAWIENPQQPSKLSAYAETYVPRLGYGWSELRSLRRGKYKLILAPRSELYDLEQDPGETHDLLVEQPDIARALRRELETLVAEAESDVTPGPTNSDTIERLRSLGYVGGTGPVSADVSFAQLADPKDRLDLYDKLNDPWLSAVGPEDPAALDEAMGRLRAVIEEAPSIPFARSLYGELLLKAGRSPEAEAVFEELLETSGFAFTALYGLALAELELGKLDVAEDHFLRAIELEPKSTKSYLRLAQIASARGNFAEAELWLRKGIDIHPDRRLREELAEVLLHTGRPTEAVDILTELSETSASDALAFYNLGQALLATGDIARALEKLGDAARRAPDDADVHQALGNALARNGEHEAAVVEFRHAVDILPCFAGAHSNMGSALAQLGRSDEAVSSYERALSCDPDYGSAYRNLASVYLQQGRVDPAIDALRSAVRLMPEDRELKAVLDDLVAEQSRSR